MDWMRILESPKFIHSAYMKKILSEGKKCCFEWCNLKSHYLLSMGADEYAQDVVELLKKIRRRHEEALAKTGQKVAAAAVKDFMHFHSISNVWEEITVALHSPRFSNIGVHGEAGMGKTMLN
ncbi:hypothetical protein SLEP1_g47882 [Rubroshorea leprosula]|uniref:Uncharacterized protein n=1 Tax=Rubroshorea leprosula TaxID=152421 RepID=A0AAV5LSS5_9ROSI|nr:hypothetical protein SLEP1_g47882 [Rubroshorea leprosula]